MAKERFMNDQEFSQGPQNKRALTAIVATLIICVFVIVSTVAAQTPVTASTAQTSASTSTAQPSSPASSSSQAMPKDNAPKLKFNPKPFDIAKLKPGVPVAFNLCNGSTPTAPTSDAEGLQMDTAQSPCGEQPSSTPNTVSGGNPPYSFQLDSGSFPPLGMHLGLNGLLYGTPAPPTLGGYKPFRVCAVDMGGTSACHDVGVPPQVQAAKGSSHTGLIVGTALLGGAAIAGVVAARSLADTSTSSSSSSGGSCTSIENSCNNLSAECLDDNNESACEQISSVCTQMCQCEGFSSFNTETGSCQ
jgi:hypothetical protein